MYVRSIILAILVLLSTYGLAAQSIHVLGPQSKEDVGHHYYLKMLTLVIEKSNKQFPHAQLKILNINHTTHGRSLILLERGTVDVFWAGTNKKREQRFVPIRIPLFFGLLGYRVSIVHQDNLSTFKAIINQPEQLKHLVACQGEHWPDSDILEDNGYKVARVTRFDLMFTMLANKRCDYFPRAIFEGYGELKIAQKEYPNLVMFDDLILHYQFPIYFFVNKNKAALAKRLRFGLMEAIQDGSLHQMMKLDPMTKNLFPLTKWQDKKYLQLNNRYLSLETPTNVSNLWLHLESKSMF